LNTPTIRRFTRAHAANNLGDSSLTIKGTSIMNKTLIFSAAATLCLLLATASSSAAMDTMEKMQCDDASMAKMQTDMDGMPDGKKKMMAMKEMGMAKDSMMKHKMKTCSMHMMKAGKMMM
jgi:hypothetical protein